MKRRLLHFTFQFLTFALLANTPPSDISISSDNINENEAIGTTVGILSSTDVDVADVHSYTLVAGVGDTDNGSFNIVGDELQTTISFDFESQNSYSIRVQTDDGNGGTYEEVLIIAVNNVNEQPIVADSTWSSEEHIANGTSIGFVTSTDIDGDDVNYTISAGNTGSAFAINPATGELTVNNSDNVDFEITPVFTLTVTGTDDGAPPLANTATITINLSNINDAPSVNTPGVQSTDEDVDLTITGLSISDQDVGTDTLDMCLSVSDGWISLSSTNGLNFSSGDGVEDESVCFRGILSDVNTALNNLTYHSDENFVGSDALVISVNDNGANGPGGSLSDLATITINVNAISVVISTQPTGNTICEEEGHLFFIEHNANPTDPVTYQWQKDGIDIAGATNDSLFVGSTSVADGGVYRCRVTNPAGTVNSNNAVLTVNPKPIASYSYEQACFGEVTIFTDESTISAGTIDDYVWSFGDGDSSFIQNPTHEFLTPGYQQLFFEITSNLGCVDTLMDSVLVDYFPDLDVVITDVCFESYFEPTNNTTIALGTMNHTWNFGDGSTSSNMNPSYLFSSTGTYFISYSVTSDKGCSVSTSKVINVNPKPNANFVVNDGCDSTLIPINGVSSISSGTISYYWAFGDGDSLDLVMNPQHLYNGSGAYDIFLTVVSDKSCIDTITKTVEIYPNPSLDIELYNPGCGSDIGTIVAHADSSTDPYFYSFEYSAFTFNDTAKYTPGIYSVRAKDFNGCITEKFVEIVAPEYVGLGNMEVEHALCYGLDNGVAWIEGAGGDDSTFYYTLAKEEGDNVIFVANNQTGEFYNLAPGFYEVNVMNAGACASTFFFGINQPDSMQVDIDANHILCKGDQEGEVAFSVSGGTPVYAYSIDNGQTFSNDAWFDSLSAGYYLIQIRDMNDCSVAFGLTLEEPQDSLNLFVASSQDIKCHDELTGSITLQGEGGRGNYLFSLDGESFANSNVFSGLPAGDIWTYVTDANNCIDSLFYTLNQPSEALLVDSLLVTDESCFGASDGTLQIFATGGTGALNYMVNQQNLLGTTINGLTNGTYSVWVEDGNQCMDSALAVIESPDEIVVNQLNVWNEICEGENNGEVNVDASGGTGVISYTLNGETNQSGEFDMLTVGNYDCWIEDETGCQIEQAIQIEADNYLPTPLFAFFNANGAVSFDNQSLDAESYLWYFGDGTTSTAFEPIHVYNSYGAYPIRLIAYNECGSDTLKKIFYYGVSGVEVTSNNFEIIQQDEMLWINATTSEVWTTMQLMDVSGRMILNAENETNGVSLQGLAEGMYYLRLYQNNKVVFIKEILIIK